MLDTIRRAQPLIIKTVLAGVVLAFVGTIFLDWGWQRGDRPDNHLATVGDEAIFVREYQAAHNNLIEFYRRAYRERFTEEMARAFQLKQQALETLIQRKLLLREARRQRLTVTDVELIEQVQNYPAFQINGAFDRNRYVQLLRLSRLSPADFEQSQREELLIAKLEQVIKAGIHLTEVELREAFLHEKEQASAEYVGVDPAPFASQVEVNETDERAYYAEGRERFRKPEQIRAAFVLIDPQASMSQVHVTDEQLAQYYEAHREEFRREAQVRARHILFRLSPQAGPEEETRVQARAEEVLQRVQADEDFATLAGTFSDDPGSAQQGGDLGFFKRGAMVKPFEDAAFALQPGEVSGPVRTDFGYHLIKLEEVQEAGYAPLTSVREQLHERLTREEAQRLAEAQAKEVREALLNEGATWEDTAARFGLRLQETPLIARGEAVENIATPAVFSHVAFALQVGEVSQPTLLDSRYALIRLLERKDSYVPTFEAVQGVVHDALVQSRAFERAQQRAQDLLADLTAGKSLEDLAQALQTQVEQTGFFSRTSAIPKLGRPLDVISEVFRMHVGDARVFTLQEKPTIVLLKERTGFDAEAYAKEKEQLRHRVLLQKRDRFFAQWLSDLRRIAEESKIVTLNQRLLTLL
ncbi:MAG: peptidylprolyl isomerase [Candidatus Entotheonellia bacterium]